MSLKGWIGVALAGVVALVALGLALRGAPPPSRTITVTGQGVVTIGTGAADRQVNLFLQVSGSSQAWVVTRLQAQRRLAQTVFTKDQVPAQDIRIHNYAVNRYGPYVKTTKPYAGNQNIQVKNLTRQAADKLVGDLLAAGITGNVNAGAVYPPPINAAERAKAEEAALADAHTQAQALAAKLGYTLGPVLKITAPPNNQNPVMYNTPQQGEITATEEVTFELR
ncbi:MAG: SIMPL domain-containing protein [Thermaerobacter sp.]|nr:SIMPL domain-containing protein [Thermaerobacter sp.]